MRHKMLIHPILENWLSGAVRALELASLEVRHLPLLPDLLGFILNEGLFVPIVHLISKVVLHIQMNCINTLCIHICINEQTTHTSHLEECNYKHQIVIAIYWNLMNKQTK